MIIKRTSFALDKQLLKDCGYNIIKVFKSGAYNFDKEHEKIIATQFLKNFSEQAKTELMTASYETAIVFVNYTDEDIIKAKIIYTPRNIIEVMGDEQAMGKREYFNMLETA